MHELVAERASDVKAPLIVVGTKQYLAVVSAVLGQRLFPVGMSGIRNWQWKPDKERLGEKAPSVPLPDWGWVPLRGRRAYVIPDGDYADNADVRAGADALIEWLASQGAEAHRVTVPLVDEDPKTGMDDYLASLPETGRQKAVLSLLQEAEDDSDDFFLGWDDLMDLPPVEPLIHGMLNQASIVWLSGKFGTYKTFLALAWACCVATGRAWEGHGVEKPGPVVYVAAEGHRGFKGRALAWASGFNGGQPVRNLIVTPRGLDPREPGDMAKLTRQVKKVGAVMVVFDTLHRCAPGMDENSNKDMGLAFSGIQKLKDDTGVTALVLHHTGYAGDRARGASSQEDDADDAYSIRLGVDGKAEDRAPGTPRILKRRKSKEGEAGDEFRLKLVKVPHDPFDPASGEAYVALMDPAESFVGEPETPVDRLVREMDEAGLPVGLSYVKSEAWLKDKGIQIPGRKDSKLQALKLRSSRAEAAGTAGTP
ncbi:AAA family ATPase [Actinacidiphila glaucinigra]|uniref:AAA family ATPase n=1 Tax=Actinacidiphila glaucinigra TaxID=235986 RepID=UPI002DD7DB65|nr:AAA family ATPase [Actinacidiphila glaucinigra]WSD58975.1 AAA family ATPase [Actinacidiphila glaucinigra]